MYDYNCPDCNDAKLQSDKNSRKINEVIEQVNALIDVNNNTADFIKEKVDEVVRELIEEKVDDTVGDIAEEKVNEVINSINTSLDNLESDVNELKEDNVDIIENMDNIKQRLDNISLPTDGVLNVQQIDERIDLKLATKYKANPIEPLNIVTTYSDGNNQPTHPSVKFFSDGWNGHKYWMAYTPYPFNNDSVENPCITYSDDGINWSEIGINNPIQNKPSSGYNSDPHLVMVNNTLECWWREVEGSKTYFKRKKSTDGVTWGVEE